MKVWPHYWHDDWQVWELDCRSWKERDCGWDLPEEGYEIPDEVVEQYMDSLNELRRATTAMTKALAEAGYQKAQELTGVRNKKE